MPIRIVKPAAPYSDVSAHRRVRATDLLAIMVPGSSRPHVPLTLLVKEWDYFPDDGAAMTEDERGTHRSSPASPRLVKRIGGLTARGVR